jgi:hypothetical protein
MLQVESSDARFSLLPYCGFGQLNLQDPLKLTLLENAYQAHNKDEHVTQGPWNPSPHVTFRVDRSNESNRRFEVVSTKVLEAHGRSP